METPDDTNKDLDTSCTNVTSGICSKTPDPTNDQTRSFERNALVDRDTLGLRDAPANRAVVDSAPREQESTGFLQYPIGRRD